MSKKKNRKGYFYEEQENAVKEYVLTTDDVRKNQIFNKILLPAFTKMIESIIRRYDLHIPNEEFNETFNDTISFLMSKIEHFDAEKISKKTGKPIKAYSYCGTICKNYLLHKRIEYKKELERDMSYDMVRDEINNNLRYSSNMIDDNNISSNMIDKSIVAIKNIIDNDTKKVLTEKEILVGNALMDLLKNWEDILIDDGSNKFNKSAILYQLRESTRLSTKEVRDSMKKYKKSYFLIKEKTLRDI